MDYNKMIDYVESPGWVDKTAAAVQPAVVKAFEAGGAAGGAVKNFLHGTWLGHPLHPILTDIPVGAYTVTAVLDTLELCGVGRFRRGADASLGVGLAGAAGSAVTGLTDWTGTSGQMRNIGMVHAVLNSSATLMNLASLFLRKKRSSRKKAIGLSLAAYGVTALAAYLGGTLVYRMQMGVDHTAVSDPYPLEFTDVAKDADVPEGKMICVKAGEIPVLLARQNGNLYALAHTCSHLGGPLSEGELLADACVKCPWHGSVFSLENGQVVEGPATEPQPKFAVRVVAGSIQVKLDDSEIIKRKESTNV